MELSVLSISDLAARTGVPQATLRSWEARYGFPEAARLPGGHRRYPESTVARVQEVQRHRRSGLALEAAVRRVTAEETPSTESLFGEVRRLHPELVPQVLSKRALLALSRAIEDECCAQAAQPILFATFQRRQFYRASYARWVELARTAEVAVVFADFAEPVAVRPRLPVEVPVPYHSPLNREWSIICEAADRPACMIGWERIGEGGRRRFEVMWSVDPQVVRHAAQVAYGLAQRYRPGWHAGTLASLESGAPAASEDLRRASGVMSRMMGYLDTGS